ncbi:MAG: hypothetical protein WD627_06425 [Actinomycetota bacterium]
MYRFKNKKKTSVIAIFLLLAVAGGAYAYWTAGGSGTGDVETGTTVALVANQTSTMTEMYPGDSPQTLSGNFENDNDGPVYVTSVTAAISGVAGGAGACSAADYTLASPVMTVGHEVAVGPAVDAWTGATIKFNNTLANQDGCKNATVTLTYTII